MHRDVAVFRWQNGSYQYDNMTLLINHVNSHTAENNVTIRWSSVSEYYDELQRRGAVQPPFTGWFAPYDYRKPHDPPNLAGYWTGMYDSWPDLKRRTRQAQAALRAAHQACSLIDPSLLTSVGGGGGGGDGAADDDLATARSAVSILQHHDALPGTSTSTAYNGSDPVRQLHWCIYTCAR